MTLYHGSYLEIAEPDLKGVNRYESKSDFTSEKI